MEETGLPKDVNINIYPPYRYIEPYYIELKYIQNTETTVYEILKKHRVLERTYINTGYFKNQRDDTTLQELYNTPTSIILKSLKNDIIPRIYIDNNPCNDIYTSVYPNTIITCINHIHEPPVTCIQPYILTETPKYIFVQKPSGIPVHPNSSYRSNNLLNILKEKYHNQSIIHRIDRETSGIIIYALDSSYVSYISRIFITNILKKSIFIDRLSLRNLISVILQHQNLLTASSINSNNDNTKEEQFSTTTNELNKTSNQLPRIYKVYIARVYGKFSIKPQQYKDIDKYISLDTPFVSYIPELITPQLDIDLQKLKFPISQKTSWILINAPIVKTYSLHFTNDNEYCYIVPFNRYNNSFNDNNNNDINDNKCIWKNMRDSAKYAMTLLRCIYSDDNTSIIQCILITGRTHQIRVHLWWLGYSIIGDINYGGNSQFPTIQLPYIITTNKIDKYCLHCNSKTIIKSWEIFQNSQYLYICSQNIYDLCQLFSLDRSFFTVYYLNNSINIPVYILLVQSKLPDWIFPSYMESYSYFNTFSIRKYPHCFCIECNMGIQGMSFTRVDVIKDKRQ